MSIETPKSRREEYAEATREALLATARQMFTTAGYPMTGIEAIARSARVTRGALYHHFADKKALFEALVIALQMEVAAKVRTSARAESDRFRQLQVGSAAFLELCTEPSYRRLVIEEAPGVLGTPRCREIEEASSIGLLIGAIGELKKAGLIDVPNAELAARMIGTMICEAALLLGDAKRPAELKRQAVATVARVLEAFRSPAAPAG